MIFSVGMCFCLLLTAMFLLFGEFKPEWICASLLSEVFRSQRTDMKICSVVGNGGRDDEDGANHPTTCIIREAQLGCI